MSGVPSLFTEDPVPSPVEDVPSGKGTARKKRITRKDPRPLRKQEDNVNPSSPVSSIASTFGRLAEQHVLEKEFKVWKACSEDQQREAFRRITTELYFHNLTYDDKLNAQKLQLLELESEKNNFESKNKDLMLKLKKVEEEKVAADNSLLESKTEFDTTMKEKEETLKSLKDENSKLAKENEQLKTDQNKVKSAAFENGFLSYLKTFVAADPDYDWTSHMGESTGKWMADFATTEAEAIAQKKIQIQAQLSREKA